MNSSKAGRAVCLDASVLVKKYTTEEGSDRLREFLNGEPTQYTTPICFFEALGVLKVKHFYRKEINRQVYDNAAFELTAWFSCIRNDIKDIEFFSPSIFKLSQDIAKKYCLDIADAFQILSVKQGFFSVLAGESQTILVTADSDLAKAAKKENIKVWNCLTADIP